MMKTELKKKISRRMTTTKTMTNPGWKKVRKVLAEFEKIKFLTFVRHSVYNEDLEEDNSDWNEVGEDEEEDDIDSDGAIHRCLQFLTKII